jgi:putative transposase
MPRLPRIDVADEIYHCINRANGRMQIFNTDQDYMLFETLMREAQAMTDIRIYAYVLMPNHWHLLVSPRKDRDLAHFMHSLCNTHTRRVHTATRTIGSGHLYQGRYKSFLVDSDEHFLTVLRYIERNPVRAQLATTCEAWEWGSAWLRTKGPIADRKLLTEPVTAFPGNYINWINTEENSEELERMRTSVNKGVPFGQKKWVDAMITKYNLESTQRNVGRPRKTTPHIY